MTVLNPYFYTLNPDLIAYENAWLNYKKTGERNDTVIKDHVWESWQRCRAFNINPLSNEAIPKVANHDMFKKMSKNEDLIYIISPYIRTIFDAVKGSGFMVTFSDNDYTILKAIYDEVIEKRVEDINLTSGANMHEEYVGTNSIDLALQLKTPVSIFGAEHYREIFHNLASVSAPIINYAGNIVGVLSVWGRNEHATTLILGMLTSSAKAIENEMKIRKINEKLIENNNQLNSILQSVHNGVVYIKNNTIMQTNNVMLSLLGKKRINNLPIEEVIMTLPEIKTIINTEQKKFDNKKITLISGNKRFNCLVNKRTIIGSHGEEVGEILIFVPIEEIKKLSKELSKHSAKYTFDDIIGNSPALNKAKSIAKKASKYDSTIIIEGESGTGKEMFAQSIHNMSGRRDYPFVAIDCGAIPNELFESTLFGYEKGAFTGANSTGSIGAFEAAQNGTLFLDEIGNMPIDMQVKLLRVMQEKAITKVGSTSLISIDVCVIVATNDNLQTLVERGVFREDLFYRLNVVYIKIPSLKERKSDIPMLVENYLINSCVRNRKISIENKAITVLQKHDWPGNIRQLFNTIERAEIMTSSNTIKVNDLPLEIVEHVRQGKKHGIMTNLENTLFKEKMSLKSFERTYVLHRLAQNNNNITKTAKELEVTRPTIYKIIK
ncbi:MAG: sigma 54-interacting transcriptional regulator [Crenarchaeota archaeon]|nr:sigma 54-interacting transcriptional regulator [Thermoproteota archaeon]